MNYDALIATLAQVHQQAQAGAAGAVNRHLILRNWLIGAHLVEFEQNGEDRAKYGEGLLERVATDLRSKDVSGCSRQMLQRMRLFYLLYPQVRSEISSPPVSKCQTGAPDRPRPLPVVVLPKPEQLQQLIETDRATWEQRHTETATAN